MNAYIDTQPNCHLFALKVSVSRQSQSAGQHSVNPITREGFVRVLRRFNGCWFAIRHIVDSSQRLRSYLFARTPKHQTDAVLDNLQLLLNAVPVTDPREFRFVRSPLADSSSVIEIRQAMSRVELSAGRALGKQLLAFVPGMFKPATDWTWEQYTALLRTYAPIAVSTALTRTTPSAVELTEWERLARRADEVTTFSWRGSAYQDENAQWVAAAYTAYPNRLQEAVLTVTQLSAPSRNTAYEAAQAIEKCCLNPEASYPFAGGARICWPDNRRDAAAARGMFTDLDFQPWSLQDELPQPLRRAPYLANPSSVALAYMPEKPVVDTSPLRVIFLAASPHKTPPLRVGEEARTIEQRLLQARMRERFEFRQHHALRWEDLTHHLLDDRRKPNIVHFSGHGSEDSEIILEDGSGHIRPVSVDILSSLFRLLHDEIGIVILNACWSQRQAEAIAQHIDVVIGMSRPVVDKSAIHFAGGFYQALAAGRDVQTAFELACLEVGSVMPKDRETPKLLVRPGVVASQYYL